MAVHAVDWDDTLVHAKSQEWQDGAVAVMQRWLIAGDKVIVHTCRANWPEGRTQILEKLAEAHLDHPNVTVEGKPLADDYIDNLAVRHAGDWQETERNVTLGQSPKPAPKPVTAAYNTAAYKAPSRPTFATRR